MSWRGLGWEFSFRDMCYSELLDRASVGYRSLMEHISKAGVEADEPATVGLTGSPDTQENLGVSTLWTESLLTVTLRAEQQMCPVTPHWKGG